jgi:recombination associated protein RdgC
MFKNAIAYRIRTPWAAPACLQTFEEVLARFAFVPCGPMEEASAGWISPRPVAHSPLLEQISGQFILKLAVERKSVPASAVNAELEIRCARIEAERGTAPQRRERKMMKEDIVRDFLPRAFSKRSSHFVWIDPANRYLVISTSNRNAADQVADQVSHLMSSIGNPIGISPLDTVLSPAVAMSHWLSTKEAPSEFTIDRDLELKQPGNEKACVRYVRNKLDIDEIAQHIVDGKIPASLAMTWNGQVSFVLTADLALKKIVLLDDIFKDSSEEKDAGFDGDVALSTGQLGLLLPDLMLALGGEPAPETGAIP